MNKPRLPKVPQYIVAELNKRHLPVSAAKIELSMMSANYAADNFPQVQQQSWDALIRRLFQIEFMNQPQ